MFFYSNKGLLKKQLVIIRLLDRKAQKKLLRLQIAVIFQLQPISVAILSHGLSWLTLSSVDETNATL